MRFRPCIDLHNGVVKQIVGGSLSDDNRQSLQINFEARKPAQWFARKYRRDGVSGGHIIRLGSGNTDAARSALSAWPNGMQFGGVSVELVPNMMAKVLKSLSVTSPSVSRSLQAN